MLTSKHANTTFSQEQCALGCLPLIIADVTSFIHMELKLSLWLLFSVFFKRTQKRIFHVFWIVKTNISCYLSQLLLVLVFFLRVC